MEIVIHFQNKTLIKNVLHCTKDYRFQNKIHVTYFYAPVFKLSVKITYSELMKTALKSPLPGNNDDIKILALSYQMDTVTVSEVTHY